MSADIVFKGNGSTFSAKYEAEKWLKENGYSYGPSCVGGPQAVIKGDYCISKWHNLSSKEKSLVDGTLDAGREGVATLRLKSSHNQGFPKSADQTND